MKTLILATLLLTEDPKPAPRAELAEYQLAQARAEILDLKKQMLVLQSQIIKRQHDDLEMQRAALPLTEARRAIFAAAGVSVEEYELIDDKFVKKESKK